MHPLIYDVAVSADGFICGDNADISLFSADGAIVDDYRTRLGTYAHCLMGRETYAFGYAFGMAPGQNPYPGMESIVVSRAITLPEDSAVAVWRDDLVARTQALKIRATGPIYLCGGGVLAGQLLASGLIDRLRLKRAPILYGSGTRLFGTTGTPTRLTLLDQTDYGDGSLFQDFALEP